MHEAYSHEEISHIECLSQKKGIVFLKQWTMLELHGAQAFFTCMFFISYCMLII